MCQTIKIEIRRPRNWFEENQSHITESKERKELREIKEHGRPSRSQSCFWISWFFFFFLKVLSGSVWVGIGNKVWVGLWPSLQHQRSTTLMTIREPIIQDKLWGYSNPILLLPITRLEQIISSWRQWPLARLSMCGATPGFQEGLLTT